MGSDADHECDRDRDEDRDRSSRQSRWDPADRYPDRDRERTRDGSSDRPRKRSRRSRSPKSLPPSRRGERSGSALRPRAHSRRHSTDRALYQRAEGNKRRDRSRDRDHRPIRESERDSHCPGRRRTADDDDDPIAQPDDRRDTQVIKRSGPLPSQSDFFAVVGGEEAPKPKEKANFGNSGALAAASNAVVQADGSAISLKYHEPHEARKPPARDQWRLFVFKGEDVIDTIELNQRTCWLIGRELAVVDIAAEHPSISKQHAAIQFRYLEKRNEFGDRIGKVRPYLIDLASANGTMLNAKKVPDSRYLELRDKDLLQLGDSTRQYVLMLAPKH